MSEWWTYRPEDFLLFSERVYWRLFELHNHAVWPVQLVAAALAATILVLLLWPRSWTSRVIALILAAAWLFAGWSFLWNAYATINWAARYAALAFGAEALLLVWFGAVLGKLPFTFRRTPSDLLPLAVVVYALFLHPLVAVLAGRPTAAAEVFAVTPDPTAMATFGLLGLSAGGGTVLLLIVVPLTWCLVSWATLVTMGTWEGWIPLAAALLVIATRPWRRSAEAG